MSDERPMVDPDAGLVPPLALAAVKRVFEAGRAKYADLDDGKAVDTRDKAHHMAKAHGHWNQYLSGDRWDDETGEHALAHAINRLLLTLERELRGLP